MRPLNGSHQNFTSADSCPSTAHNFTWSKSKAKTKNHLHRIPCKLGHMDKVEMAYPGMHHCYTLPGSSLRTHGRTFRNCLPHLNRRSSQFAHFQTRERTQARPCCQLLISQEQEELSNSLAVGPPGPRHALLCRGNHNTVVCTHACCSLLASVLRGACG